MVVVPLMGPGVTGVAVSTVIVCDEAADVPQALPAVTVMLPLVELAVVIIELVDDDPVHPLGNVHV